LIKRPLKIGLTGGIGSGKTTISHIFQSLGIEVFNSDQYGKKAIEENKTVIKKIHQEFGEDIITNGHINKKNLSKIVFQDITKLRKLNNIIHPIVIQDFNKWYSKKTNHYIIKESALLFESKTFHNLDAIILIKAPVELRINRVYQRDNRSRSEILSIIKNQLKTKDIKEHTDYIINNNEKTLLTPKVIQLHKQLMNL